ncbi:LysR family transcriptional regulator [Acetobacteraceae bacterium H6797]|nr:LysR family transcriptional regulator [Acetobacteraceae bacterium H6797]
MNNIDGLALDGHALRLFLAVLEEGSVTAAAARLGLSQSAASHALNRLRAQLGDPLFVKAGRGIAPTPHARGLAGKVHTILDTLRELARPEEFEPARAKLNLTIAANDFQRDLLLPAFYARVSAVVAALELRIIPSGAPQAELLRERDCDLLITPLPPSGTDIVQKRLLADRYACFYDPSLRAAPQGREDYLRAQHATVIHAEGEALEFDRKLEARGLHREITLRVPSFSAVAAFLRGSDMLATLPSLLRHSALQGFASVPVPLGPGGKALERLPLYLAWHRRDQQDPRHSWLREQMMQVARDVAEGAG